MVTIKGTIVEITSEVVDEHFHKLATRYLGIGNYYYRKPRCKVTGLSGHPAFYFLGYLPGDEKKE